MRPDTVIHVWKGGWQNELAKVTARKLRALISTPWYLDYISYGPDWHNYYATEPLSFNGLFIIFDSISVSICNNTSHIACPAA